MLNKTTMLFFFNFQAPMLGGGGAKNCIQTKYLKFKLNFDEERGSKIEKKVKLPKKIG